MIDVLHQSVDLVEKLEKVETAEMAERFPYTRRADLSVDLKRKKRVNKIEAAIKYYRQDLPFSNRKESNSDNLPNSARSVKEQQQQQKGLVGMGGWPCNKRKPDHDTADLKPIKESIASNSLSPPSALSSSKLTASSLTPSHESPHLRHGSM